MQLPSFVRAVLIELSWSESPGRLPPVAAGRDSSPAGDQHPADIGASESTGHVVDGSESCGPLSQVTGQSQVGSTIASDSDRA